MNETSTLLGKLSNSQVLVVGDLMVDEYLWGHVERISAEAPVPILKMIRQESTLGGAGNVVKNLRSLGSDVTVVGAIGNDGTGNQVVELLQVLGVDGSGLIRDPTRVSTVKTRLMSIEHGQQVFRLDKESAQPLHGEIEERLIRAVGEMAKEAKAIICSDYLKGVLTERVLRAVFGAASEYEIPTIVAPKDAKPSKYDGATVLMPNVKELGQMVGTRPDGSDWLTDSARRLVKALGLQTLVVTRGNQGMSLFEPTREGVRRVDVPAVARSVYDVTGAGDTALATFTAALASGADCEIAVRVANVAAGIVVGKRGTATVTVDEIREHLEDRKPRPRRPRKSLSGPAPSL